MQSDAWRRLRMYLSRYVDRVLARSCACEHPRRRWTPSWLAHDVFGRQKLVGSGPGRPSPPLDGGRVSGWLQILSSHRRSSGKSHTLAICRTDKQHDDKQTDSPPANTKPPITIPTPPRRGGDGARTAGQSAICACEPEITDPDMSDAQQRAVAIAKLGRPAGCWLAGWHHAASHASCAGTGGLHRTIESNRHNPIATSIGAALRCLSQTARCAGNTRRARKRKASDLESGRAPGGKKSLARGKTAGGRARCFLLRCP